MGCSRSHEGTLALDAGENLLPSVVADVLKRDRQWLIEIDAFIEEIDCALSFPLSESLLSKAGAERQHLERAEVPPRAGDHELHRTEVHVRLDAVERHVPEIWRPSARASRDRRNRLLVALLQLAQCAIGVGREQRDEILVERNCPLDQSLQFKRYRTNISPEA